MKWLIQFTSSSTAWYSLSSGPNSTNNVPGLLGINVEAAKIII